MLLVQVTLGGTDSRESLLGIPIRIPVQWVQRVVIEGGRGRGEGMGKRRKTWKECISMELW